MVPALLGRGEKQSHDKQPLTAMFLPTYRIWHLKSLIQWPLSSGFSSEICSEINAGFFQYLLVPQCHITTVSLL